MPRTAAALPVAVAALTLAACGATLPEPSLHNIAQVQTAIEQSLAAAAHLRGTAYCPTDVPAVKGQVFSCVVAIPGRTPAIYRVTVQTPQGFVSYSRMQ
jgi:hypothetical protein